MNTLVTGATGFIGSHLSASLQRDGHNVFLLSRCAAQAENVRYGDLTKPGDLSAVFAGIDTLFHCAGLAHVWRGEGATLTAQHWAVNFEGTRNLFEAAGRVGVRRAVFLSSVKAMGEPGDNCVDEDWATPPTTAYGQAKRAAEEAVLNIGHRYGMHVVNLRLAMVYGPGGRGNLARMADMIRRGRFPPLPETGNRRSLVHVDDVVEVIKLVAEEKAAAGKTYIVADGRAYSGREIYLALRMALGLSKKVGAVPAAGLKALAGWADLLERILKRRLPFNTEVLDKLLGSACYSPRRIEQELGWKASIPLQEGLQYMGQRKSS